MEYWDFPIRQKTPIKKQPTPTDYSSILVHRLRNENQMLREKIKQLCRDRSTSPIRAPIKQIFFLKNRDNIQYIFDSKLKGIKERSLSATKSSKASQRDTPLQKHPQQRNSIATDKETAMDRYQYGPVIQKTHKTARKIIDHQPQTSFSSTLSDNLYKGIYLNDSVANQNIQFKSPRVCTQIQSIKPTTENSAQIKKEINRGVTDFGCKKQSVRKIHRRKDLQSLNYQKEKQEFQLRMSSPKINIPQSTNSFKKGRLRNNVYLQEGQKLDDQKSNRMKTVRN